MSVRIPYVIWDSESDTYRRGVTIYETRPVYALGPIQDRYGDGSAAWERERWILFNDIGQPEITSIRPRKNSPLDKMPLPYEDSDQAIVMDLDGVTREYEISGTCGGTADEINLFVAKMEMLLNGSQMDEESLRFIQRYPDQVPARVRWDNGWKYGDEVGSRYPAVWAGDSICGLNIGVAIESFDWEFTTDAADEITWTISITEGVTW